MMVELHVIIYAAKVNLTDEEKKKEINDLSDLMRSNRHVYLAAKELQLSLPDLKDITFQQFNQLRDWKEKKLQSKQCDKSNILAAVAEEYQRMKLNHNSDTEVEEDYELESDNKKNDREYNLTVEAGLGNFVESCHDSPSSSPATKRSCEHDAEQNFSRPSLKKSRYFCEM